MAEEPKERKYGRLRRRRGRVAVLLGALALVVLALPVLLQTPEILRRATHPLEYEETIREAAAERDVEPALVAAVIRTESRFEPEVESPEGAYGLMQIQPDTARFISERGGVGGDYRDPKTNIRMGTWYLDYLRGRYEGDERLVLAAYNSGEGRVDAWISEGNFDVSQDIPVPETREYVENVLEARGAYTELYGRNLEDRKS